MRKRSGQTHTTSAGLRRLLRVLVLVALAGLPACSSDEPTGPSEAATGTLAGVVSSDWWGTSIAVTGATISITGVAGGSVTSDASGQYRFDALTEGTYQLKVEAPNHEPSTIPSVLVSANSVRTRDVALTRRQSEIAGTALSRFDGSPYPGGVQVNLTPEGRDTGTSVTADELGGFSASLPMGSYTLQTSDQSGRELFDFGQSDTVVLDAASISLDLRLLPMLDSDLTIDFETPRLASREWNRTIAPYTDGSGTARFSGITPPGAGFTAATGLVVNSFSSACAPPSDLNQKLGTGSAGVGASGSSSSVGFAGHAVRLDFMGWLPPGSTVSAEFQALAEGVGRIRVLDGNDAEVAMVSDSLGPSVGTCVVGRNPAGRKRIAVSVDAPTSSMRFDVLKAVGSGGFVWLLDDVEVAVGR